MRMRSTLTRECPARACPAGGGAGVGRTAHRAGGKGGPVGLARPLPSAQALITAADLQGAMSPTDRQAQHQSMITRLRGDPGLLAGFSFGQPLAASRQPQPSFDDGGGFGLRPAIAVTAASRSSSTIRARSPSPSATAISCSSRAPTAPDPSPSSRSPEPALAAHSTWSPAAATSSSAHPPRAERDTGARYGAAPRSLHIVTLATKIYTSIRDIAGDGQRICPIATNE